MNAKVKKKIDALEAQRELLFKQIKNVSDSEANKSPDSASWSIAQVMLHLVLIEEWSLGYLKKRLDENDLRGKTGIKESIKYNLLNIFLSLPFKYKAPKSVGSNMPNDLNLEELKRRWITARNGFKELFQEAPDHVLSHRLFKHPFIGYINVYQMFGFMYAHAYHHLPQIKRLLSKNNT